MRNSLSILWVGLTLAATGCASLMEQMGERDVNMNDYENAVRNGQRLRGDGRNAESSVPRVLIGAVKEPDQLDYDRKVKGLFSSRFERSDGQELVGDPRQGYATRGEIERRLASNTTAKEAYAEQSAIDEAEGLPVAQRAKKEDFVDAKEGDGSLWSSDGQTNYFFTKNRIATHGDIISLQLEDAFIKEIGNEIKRGLTPPEQEIEIALAQKGKLDGSGRLPAGNPTPGALKTANSEPSRLPGRSSLDLLSEKDLKTSDAEKTKDSMQKALVWSQLDLAEGISIKPGESVMAEIVDRYPNGNYKIRATRQISFRGQKRLMKVVGVVRGSDVEGSESIPTGKLYEYSVSVL